MKRQASELLHIPGHTLLGRLATSATAELFDAVEEKTGRRVAIKAAFNDTPGAEMAARRMETEWLIGRSLRHAHLVRMYNAGKSTNGRFWIAMERLYGHDLRKELNRFERLHPKRTVHILLQLCQALEVLHCRGVVHRDIKPENVFLCAEGPHGDYAKLIDLGILGLPNDDPDRRHPTTGHVVIGTPEYLSPEQARGVQTDARADVYSVGVMMYHLLSGKLPFIGDLRQVLLAHAHARPPSLRDCGVDLPPPLVDLVHRCLAKDPALRPASASSLGEELLAIIPETHGYYEPRAHAGNRQIPEIPELHLAEERQRFSEALNHWIRTLWSDGHEPLEIVESREGVQESEVELGAAEEEAGGRRRDADEAAADRLKRRTRMGQTREEVHAELEAAHAAYVETVVAIMGAVERIEDADRRYGAAMRNLRDVIRANPSRIDTALIEETSSELEQAYDLRQEGMTLESASQEKADRQARRLAELRTQFSELAATLSALDVEEQTVGARLEAMANRAQEEADAARHALEHRYLRLYLLVLRQSQHQF